jgi:CDP-4-dehydro-6-deoxyglucose reductase, E3
VLPPTFDAEVVQTRELSPSVREIRFARADGEVFAFEPGQWVSLVLSSPDGEVRRAYSVASPPRGDPSFDVAVNRVASGRASGLLHALERGDVVRAIGPQGFFTRAGGPAGEPAPASLFIGTGTGVAPLRSMIHAAASSDPGVPLWLLFGGREEHDLLYRDELAALASRSPNVRIEQTLSRGSGSWTGRRGYVQAHARELYEELARTTSVAPHVYICGLERMVGAVRTLFRQDLGLPRQRVHSERYD